MLIFRAAIHGQLIELRRTDHLGAEEVLLNGRPVSHRAWWSLRPSSHHFDIVDESGRARHVEAAVRDISKLGLGSLRLFVMVDGLERARVEAEDLSRPVGACANCGYQLAGLPAEGGEVRCPECGRHPPAVFIARE